VKVTKGWGVPPHGERPASLKEKLASCVRTGADRKVVSSVLCDGRSAARSSDGIRCAMEAPPVCAGWRGLTTQGNKGNDDQCSRDKR
jgi:hypothetical protein